MSAFRLSLTRIRTLRTRGRLMKELQTVTLSVETGKPPTSSILVLCHDLFGYSENVLALQAPQTSKCDFCQVSFCGINVQGRCVALPLTSQHPHNMSDIGDLIQSAEVYDCFDGNTVEVEFMLDHITAQGYTPRHVYREVSCNETAIDAIPNNNFFDRSCNITVH